MGNIFVLYHSNCRDGFAAAWSAWKRFGEGAKYIPCGYGKEPPKMPDGSKVYIVDFSFPKATLLALAERMTMVVVLDHHKSAMEDLAGLPTVDDRENSEDGVLGVDFNMDKSGARLAWEYFHPGEELPPLVLWIEDRDLWKFTFPETKRFGAFINSIPMEFDVWDNIVEAMEDMDDAEENYLLQGEAILRMMSKDADRMCWGRTIRTSDDRPTVVLVNATTHFSEVCERLLELEPKADFACVYGINQKYGNVLFSLRSRPGTDCDVGAIAKQFGGGGHKHSAGFKLESNSIQLQHVFGGILQ